LRKFFCFLLIALIPLQAIASQGGFAFLEDAFDVMHELLHDEIASHHHDEDGSIHFSDSKESVKHLAEHTANIQPPGLLPTVFLPEVTLCVLSRVFSHTTWYLPDPHLKSLQRPPQTAS
jgi:hypothetical protein